MKRYNLNSDLKCITKQKRLIPINKIDIIKLFKTEFNRYIQYKSLDVSMSYSIKNPVLNFEFIKKEK